MKNTLVLLTSVPVRTIGINPQIFFKLKLKPLVLRLGFILRVSMIPRLKLPCQQCSATTNSAEYLSLEMHFIVFQWSEGVSLPTVRRAYFEKTASPIRHSKLLETLAQISMKAFSTRIFACYYCLGWFII